MDRLIREPSVRSLALFKREQRRQEFSFSELFQRPPQFRLENDQQAKGAVHQRVLRNPENGIHFKNSRNENEYHDENHALYENPCLGILDPYHDMVYHKGNDDNLNDIRYSQ